MELGPIQKRWIESLKAHPERQLTEVLGIKNPETGEYKACCLGEGGLIAGICEWDFNKLAVIDLANHGGTSTNKYKSLVFGSYMALGLHSSAGSPNDLIGYSLEQINDRGTSWPEIADLLEKNPERYFSESK